MKSDPSFGVTMVWAVRVEYITLGRVPEWVVVAQFETLSDLWGYVRALGRGETQLNRVEIRRLDATDHRGDEVGLDLQKGNET